jgi:hypothetical protein
VTLSRPRLRPWFQGNELTTTAGGSLSEAIDILSQIDFFQDLSGDALSSVAATFTVWAYDAGQGVPP